MATAPHVELPAATRNKRIDQISLREMSDRTSPFFLFPLPLFWSILLVGVEMPFKIISSDITTLTVDALVNPSDQYYSGGGGVDRAIHNICGQELRNATDKLKKLHLGEVRITEGFALPAKYIFHTSSPHWTGRSKLELDLLGSCYRNSIQLASILGLKSIAFPLVASRGKHFPREVAFTVAVNAVKEALEDYPLLNVLLVLFKDNSEKISEKLMELVSLSLVEYIPDESYLSLLTGGEETEEYTSCAPSIMSKDDINALIEKPTEQNLSKIAVDESFSEMLKRLMEEKKVPNTYLQDELDLSAPGLWKLLKGRSNPQKLTVFALSIALRLNLEETKEMLMKAGYAINESSLEDIILASLISNEIYDRYTIDNLLYSLDLALLPGAVID